MFKFLFSLFKNTEENRPSSSYKNTFRDDRIISQKPQPRNAPIKKSDPISEPAPTKDVEPWALLKRTASLKKQNKYQEACEVLVNAYKIAEEQNAAFGAKEYMRVAMYYQLDGKNDEGWRVLNEVNLKFTDVYSQAEIANQMRVFLEKEKNHKLSVIYCIWSRCKMIERDSYNIESSREMIEKFKKNNEYEGSAFEQYENRIKSAMNVNDIELSISKLLKRAGIFEISESIAIDAAKYLSESGSFDLREIHQIIDRHWP